MSNHNNYKIKEDLDRVVTNKKPESVIKTFFVSYKQGLAYQEFIDSVRVEYNEKYPNDINYLVYDKLKTIIDENGEEQSIPDIDNPNDLPLKPTFNLCLQGVLEHYTDPVISDEEFNEFYKPYKRELLNKQRDEEVANLTIDLTLNDEVVPFDADEVSQLRITRALQVLEDDDDTLDWIDANGDIRTLTKAQINEGLKLASYKQSNIFMRYAKLKEEL